MFCPAPGNEEMIIDQLRITNRPSATRILFGFVLAYRGTAMLALLLAAALLNPVTVKADFMLRFDETYSGTSPASPNAPWICAWFQDIAPGTVRLTISNVALTTTESVDSLYFNFSPLLGSGGLMLNCFAQGGDFDRPTVSLGTNQFKAGGDGRYDLLFSFTHGGTQWNRFTKYEFLTYSISGIPGLTSSDFEYLSASTGPYGPFYAAAHISRIGPTSESGWIAASVTYPISVPEPSAALLLSWGLGLGLAYRFWKATKNLPKPKPQLITVERGLAGRSTPKP